ncbi:chromosome segregation protein SMC [Sporomusa sphaeroides DSM 2875]|uniref:chromosome segregation protein SMC n=1 Tax=Sporomusa sphaeroides TaxID=47679 RepID=UPI0020307F60|nr:chromosome segregation protein SMC [Sporomusa sphaeroides]MCM0760234.1 chromosome segregation protein SMC [Sporomusa sphaeroides DSM 2875]
MLLRRLEAYGFKSFAEKTELEFGQGITAIVGPNGSGKSNISDAIRWALGEQSLRTLRGAKMEDVIFAGSVNRRPLGVAEVSLVFDNSDGQLALDFSEVTITRRVFRSGDSEYYINKTPCRLKDIHEMLADTGLGRDSMTVIGQNKVDEILSSKPEERRLLFEEAAGIIKYKQRKRDALRKLDDTEQNLTRVRDITAELESQLEPLKESADRTSQFNLLNTELTACQATLLLERLTKAEKLVESAKLEQANVTDRSIAASARLTTADNEKDALTLTLAQTEEAVTCAEKNIQEVTQEIERTDSRTGVLAERIEQGQKAQARFDEELARLTAEKQAAEVKLNELYGELEAKQGQILTANAMLAEKSRHSECLAAGIRQLEQQIEAGKEQTFEHLQLLVNERNALRMLERDLAALTAQQMNFAKERENYLNRQQEISAKDQQLKAETQALADRRKDFEQQINLVQQNKAKLEYEYKNILETEQQLAGKVNETSSRLSVLTSMQQELEGFGRAIKGILKHQSSWRQGICGAVAQLLTVPDTYVNAIEVALGGAQQHLVADTDQTAKQAISFLKTQKLGRATFLPLNTIKISKPREAEILAANQPGALGFAADVVGVSERYRSVVNYLLGRVIIAKTIDHALTIARNCGFSVKIVTLDGELINPGGSLTGGSMGRKEASFIARNNEIDTLKQALTALKEQREILEQEKAALASAITGANAQLAGYDNNVKEIELRQAELAIHLAAVRTEDEQCKLALRTITAEVADGQREILVCQQKLEQSKTSIASLETREIGYKSQVEDWQGELKIKKAEQQAIGDELTDAKIKLSAITQAVTTARAGCEQAGQLQASLAAQLARIHTEKQQLQSENGQAQDELASLSASKEGLLRDKCQLVETRQALYADKLEKLAGIGRLDKEIKDLRRQSADLQNKLHELELLVTKYTYEAANCHEQLTGQLALTIEEARALKRSDSIEQLLQTIASLEQQIAALGPVNPAAIEEYNRVRERYAFLQGQVTDLSQAKEYLTSVIKDIDITMSRQFNIAFKAINQYFGDVFNRLFGGGRAELVLIEPGNILETGIDIIVQPPGKKLQNLALLSGGERALTVIALLFAILTYRPAPFCVVDEIDAALDEANVQRFSEFLRDYAQNTQFIIVTHRKGTMEAAGVLHGVTMEESGISRLVSVKFMDKAG